MRAKSHVAIQRISLVMSAMRRKGSMLSGTARSPASLDSCHSERGGENESEGFRVDDMAPHGNRGAPPKRSGIPIDRRCVNRETEAWVKSRSCRDAPTASHAIHRHHAALAHEHTAAQVQMLP